MHIFIKSIYCLAITKVTILGRKFFTASAVYIFKVWSLKEVWNQGYCDGLCILWTLQNLESPGRQITRHICEDFFRLGWGKRPILTAKLNKKEKSSWVTAFIALCLPTTNVVLPHTPVTMVIDCVLKLCTTINPSFHGFSCI